MNDVLTCDFCDHAAVSVRLDDTFTCEYCGAEHLLAEGWEDFYDKPVHNAIGNDNVWTLRAAPSVQVPGEAEATTGKRAPGDGDGGSSGS